MAKIQLVLDAVASLDGKVTAHLDADGAAVLQLTQVVADRDATIVAKDAEIADLKAQLAAGGVSDEDLAGAVSAVNAVAARL